MIKQLPHKSDRQSSPVYYVLQQNYQNWWGKKKSNSHHTGKKRKISERDVIFSAQILYRDRSSHDIPTPIDTTGAEGRKILPGSSVPCISEASLSPEKKRIQIEKQFRKALGNAESKANVFTPPTMHPGREFLFLTAMKKQLHPLESSQG